MESIPETRHGKTGESAKKIYQNDSGLHGFELRKILERCGQLESRRRRGG